MHRICETLAADTEQVVLRNTAVLENQFIGCGTADTHLLFLDTECESRCSLFHDECGEALLLAAALVFHDIGVSDDDVDICFLTIGDEALGAVEHPFLCFFIKYCFGLCTLCIRTGARFGQRKRAELFTLCQRYKVLLFLFFGTVGHDRIDAERGMRTDDNAGCAADLCELLNTHDICERVASLSAVLLRYGNSHEAVLLHFCDGLTREFFCFIHFDCERLDFGFGKLPEQVTRHLMLFIQLEIHNLLFLRFILLEE